MKYLQVVVFSLCVVAISCRNRQDIMDCMNKHGLQMDEMKSYRPDNPSDTQKCVAGCAALKKGFPNNIDQACEKLGKRLNDDGKVILRECFAGIQSTEDCEIGQDMFACKQKAKGNV